MTETVCEDGGATGKSAELESFNLEPSSQAEDA